MPAHMLILDYLNAGPQNRTIRLPAGVGSLTVGDNQIAPPAGDTDPTTNILDYDIDRAGIARRLARVGPG
jgi:hypothetical protein